MCGRYSLTTPVGQLVRQFKVSTGQSDLFAPLYQAVPSFNLPVIFNDSPTEFSWCTWGFLPPWSRGPERDKPLINARAETLAELKSFKTAFARQRCLVIADGFFEWRATPYDKQPYRIVLSDKKPFAFAGIWGAWRENKGYERRGFAIVTCEPNTVVAPIHNRMPVILPAETYETWLNPDLTEPEQLTPLLQPYPASLMQAYPVSKAVNYPSNNTPEVTRPVHLEPA